MYTIELYRFHIGFNVEIDDILRGVLGFINVYSMKKKYLENQTPLFFHYIGKDSIPFSVF